MLRRDLLKSLPTMLAAPALPAVATTLPSLGTKPVHTAAAFREALGVYLDAYVAFFSPRDWDSYECGKLTRDREILWEEDMGRLCKAWADARERLLAMVLENHGLDPDRAFLNVTAVSVDLDDVSFVAAADPDCEGERQGDNSLAIIPRSQALRERLESLPAWENDERLTDRKDPTTWTDHAEYKRENPIPPDYPPGFDLSRLPVDEPVPTGVQLLTSNDGERTTITRTWTEEGAAQCARCGGCPLQREEDKYAGLTCRVIVPTADVDTVLYSTSPKEAPFYRPVDPEVKRGVLVDKTQEFHCASLSSKYYWTRLVVAKRGAWKRFRASQDSGWCAYKFLGGRLVVAVQLRPAHPRPWILNV